MRRPRFLVKVHAAFEVSLILKGAFAAAEVMAGVASYLIPPHRVLDLVQVITRAELTEDPRDFVAVHLLHAAQGLSMSRQHFAAVYLLSHGIIKSWLILGLWRGKLAYYPAAIAVFSFFILYQAYRFSLSHSFMLLGLTAVDVVVIWLTRLEYRRLRGPS